MLRQARARPLVHRSPYPKIYAQTSLFELTRQKSRTHREKNGLRHHLADVSESVFHHPERVLAEHLRAPDRHKRRGVDVAGGRAAGAGARSGAPFLSAKFGRAVSRVKVEECVACERKLRGTPAPSLPSFRRESRLRNFTVPPASARATGFQPVPPNSGRRGHPSCRPTSS